jgi:hypothetical protein
MIDFFI